MWPCGNVAPVSLSFALWLFAIWPFGRHLIPHCAHIDHRPAACQSSAGFGTPIHRGRCEQSRDRADSRRAAALSVIHSWNGSGNRLGRWTTSGGRSAERLAGCAVSTVAGCLPASARPVLSLIGSPSASSAITRSGRPSFHTRQHGRCVRRASSPVRLTADEISRLQRVRVVAARW